MEHRDQAPTGPAPPAGGGVGRGVSSTSARVPWGTSILFCASGTILLFQVLARSPWGAAFLLSPGDLSLRSVFTYAFFHADLLHWAVNMAFLLLVAPRLERGIGAPRLLALFLMGAVVAGLLHISIVGLLPADRPAAPLLGASGGIMALLGAYAVRYYSQPVSPALVGRVRALIRAHRVRPPFDIIGKRTASLALPVGWILFAWFVSEVVFGWRQIVHGGGAVAHWAHVGGFLTGVALAAFAGLHTEGRREEAVSQGTLDLQARSLAVYLRDHPDDTEARRVYAAVLARLGDVDRARRAFARALEDDLAANRHRAAADTWIALHDAGLDPLNPALELKAAQALESVGQPDHALAVYDRLSPADGPEAETAGLRAARLADRLNLQDDAAQRYHAFLLMHPHSPFIPSVRRSLARLAKQAHGLPRA